VIHVAGQDVVEVCDSQGSVGTATVESRCRSFRVLPPAAKQKRQGALAIRLALLPQCPRTGFTSNRAARITV